MMKLKKPFAILIGTCTVLLPMDLPALADSNQTEALKPFDTQFTWNKSENPDTFYDTARQELPEDFYVLYRIIERIARANGLDELPWRVQTAPSYDINAFATEVNLLVFYYGLLDQLHGDYDALAFIVGHEMAHHTQRHIAVGEAEQAEILARIQAEAEAEVLAEMEDASSDSRNARNAGGIFRALDNVFGNSGIGDIPGALLENESQERLQEANERIEQISAERTAQLEAEWAELNHNQEFESDELGYIYATRAGFDPQGSFRAMEVLNRVLGSQTASSSHPATPDRIEALRVLETQHPATNLVAEGRTHLTTSNQPLTYDLSRDGASLRINSRYSSNDIDSQFPQ